MLRPHSLASYDCACQIRLVQSRDLVGGENREFFQQKKQQGSDHGQYAAGDPDLRHTHPHEAEKYRRVHGGLIAGTVTSILLVIAMGQAILIKPAFFAGLFTDDPEAVGHCVSMMRLIIPFYVVMSVHAIISNVIRGFGRPTSAMVLAIAGMVLCRQSYLAIAMSRNPVVENIFWSYPMGWIFASAMEVAWFLWISRSVRRKAREEQAAHR